jgi:beta-1,4-N-acetylglucosaminyltransferase
VVYVESVARTTTLSLSGWIVYALGLADAVFVQWEGLLKKYPRAKYAGRVV